MDAKNAGNGDSGGTDTRQQQQNVTNDLVVTHLYFLKINVKTALLLILTYQLFLSIYPWSIIWHNTSEPVSSNKAD